MENAHRATYFVVPPRNDGTGVTGEAGLRLQMKVPDKLKEQEHRSCEDVVKVFVISRPTSFGLLELS